MDELTSWYTGIRQIISCFACQIHPGGPRSSERRALEVAARFSCEVAPSVSGLAFLGLIMPESGVLMGSFVLYSVSVILPLERCTSSTGPIFPVEVSGDIRRRQIRTFVLGGSCGNVSPPASSPDPESVSSRSPKEPNFLPLENTSLLLSRPLSRSISTFCLLRSQTFSAKAISRHGFQPHTLTSLEWRA